MTELLAGCYEVLKADGSLLVIEATHKNKIAEERYQRLRSANALPGTQQDSSMEVGLTTLKKNWKRGQSSRLYQFQGSNREDF
jgi:hypothetical protein